MQLATTAHFPKHKTGPSFGHHKQLHDILPFFPLPLNINPPHHPIMLIPPLRARTPTPNVCPKARDAHFAGAGFA